MRVEQAKMFIAENMHWSSGVRSHYNGKYSLSLIPSKTIKF